eukprot:3129023-Prymnesium_polylepis.1
MATNIASSSASGSASSSSPVASSRSAPATSSAAPLLPRLTRHETGRSSEAPSCCVDDLETRGGDEVRHDAL